jgi:hypothetical protein
MLIKNTKELKSYNSLNTNLRRMSNSEYTFEKVTLECETRKRNLTHICISYPRNRRLVI